MRALLGIAWVLWLLGPAGCGMGTIGGYEQDGADGVDGPDGGDGADGVDGLDGGDDGPDGRDGADGDEGDDDPQPWVDTDGDGLSDAFERAAGDVRLLDPLKADTDGDGIPDGLEDPDQDGLTNLQEQAAGRVAWRLGGPGPHPLQADLLVEVDAMQGRAPSDAVLAGVAEAYLAAPHDNPDGSQGIGVHFLLDELDLPAQEMTGSFEQRHALFRDHPPARHPELPAELGGALVHVIVAVRRTDIPDRGGEVVTTSSGNPEETGVLIYRDVIEANFPACARPPPSSAISFEEMFISTLVHELGHCLQLGHDTELGGGINYFNIMSVPTSCAEAHMRTRGDGNLDPDLGATEEEGVPRFSRAAVSLMRLTQKLSVEESTLQDGDDGYEM